MIVQVLLFGLGLFAMFVVRELRGRAA